MSKMKVISINGDGEPEIDHDVPDEDPLECPECGATCEVVEGAFMNELGEAEFRGIKCPACGWVESQ